jgi:magnesium-transporting ATPase (P-type)
MTVTAIFAGRRAHAVHGTGYRPEGRIDGLDEGNAALQSTLLAGLLCNDTRIEYDEGEKVIGDPTEAALLVSAVKGELEAHAEGRRLPRLDTLPFESEHQYMATLHDQGNAAPRLAFFKGRGSVLQRAARELQADGSLAPLDQDMIRPRSNAWAWKACASWPWLQGASGGQGNADP